MKIRDFLKIKSRSVISIGPDETVSAAMQKLVDNNIGALPVTTDDGELLGIISERDLLRECLNRSNAVSTTRLQDVMNKSVVVATPDEDLEYVTSIMKQKNIRHLPIVVGQKVEGMISMRDIVNERLQEAEAEIRYIGLMHTRPSRPLT